ncbi:MAG: hypothetical protein LBC73_06980 [Oscillospiraceae bacterium]|jgi:hypothetical protein|nr:hypothetical protein [Oscillospiraceae bacterium]
MKKRFYIITVITAACIICIGIVASVITYLTNREERRVFHAVVNYVDEYGDSIITLGELMDFEWDTLAYFISGISKDDINQAIGATYIGPTSTVEGFIFVKDGEVVYYEIFRDRFDPEIFASQRHLNRTKIFLDARIPAYYTERNIRVFTHYDEFEIGLNKYGEYYIVRSVSEEEITRGDFVRHEFDSVILRVIQDFDRAKRNADLRGIELFVFSYTSASEKYGFVLDRRRGGWVYYDTDTSGPGGLKFFVELKNSDFERLINVIEESGLRDWEDIYYDDSIAFDDVSQFSWSVGIKYDNNKRFNLRGLGNSSEGHPPEEQFSVLTDFIRTIGAEIMERHIVRSVTE